MITSKTDQISNSQNHIGHATILHIDAGLSALIETHIERESGVQTRLTLQREIRNKESDATQQKSQIRCSIRTCC
jgi:hypothetical protein